MFGSEILFTGEQLIYKASLSKPLHIYYSDIESVNHIKISEKEEFIIINLKSSANNIKLDSLASCDYKKFSEVLKDIINNFEEYKEEDQFKPLSGMNEELKIAYIQVVINMAYSSDEKLDEKKFAEILMMMTRLDLSTESRFKLREYITKKTELKSLENILDVIKKESPESQYKAVCFSLVKDLISVYMSVNGGLIEDFEFFHKNKALLGVTDEEVKFAVETIKEQLNWLKENYTDDALQKSLKELVAKSASVGVPLAAVYLSGSVIGMSAAGMTSGLATLGLGGMLGLSSMATGIGVLVLLGVGTYKGVRHFTGADELNKFQHRELMLNEVIKQTQSTISLLIEDINYITVNFNDALSNIGIQDEKLKGLEL